MAFRWFLFRVVAFKCEFFDDVTHIAVLICYDVRKMSCRIFGGRMGDEILEAAKDRSGIGGTRGGHGILEGVRD